MRRAALLGLGVLVAACSAPEQITLTRRAPAQVPAAMQVQVSTGPDATSPVADRLRTLLTQRGDVSESGPRELLVDIERAAATPALVELLVRFRVGHPDGELMQRFYRRFDIPQRPDAHHAHQLALRIPASPLRDTLLSKPAAPLPPPAEILGAFVVQCAAEFDPLPRERATDYPVEVLGGGPLTDRGVALLRAGLYAHAITMLESAVVADDEPTDAAWYDLGLAYEALGRDSEARAAYRKAGGDAAVHASAGLARLAQ